MHKKTVNSLLPLIGFCLFIVFAISSFIFIAYLVFIGLIIGGAYYLIMNIKKMFIKNNSTIFSTKVSRTSTQHESQRGRVIDQDK